MKRGEPNRRANIWVARTVPLSILGILGYGSWVVTETLCVDYLLRPPPLTFRSRQVGPAVAILVLYYVLLCIMLICYARLIYVVTVNPGLVPRGSHWYVAKENALHKGTSKTKEHARHRKGVEETKSLDSERLARVDLTKPMARRLAHDADLHVENFWKRDVFVCGYDGRPPFCSTCYNWKPDRAHHCSELNRCVVKMDHFCPWVGGVVGETSFKFFVQFSFWAALFCTHVLVFTAYYVAQRRRAEGTINAHWAVILGLGGFFFLFSAGMCMSCMQFVLINSTTIENLSRKSKVWYLAVHLPAEVLLQIEERGRSNLRLITYPRPPAEQFQILEQNGADITQEAVENASESVADCTSPQEKRTFAILETLPGSNPFDLGFKRNFTDIMGYSLWDWLAPVKASPCIRHDLNESFYMMGPVVAQLKREAGIRNVSTDSSRARRRSSRHKRRRSTGRSRSHEASHRRKSMQ